MTKQKQLEFDFTVLWPDADWWDYDVELVDTTPEDHAGKTKKDDLG